MNRRVLAIMLCGALVTGAYAALPVTDGLIVELRADALEGPQDGDPVVTWSDIAQDDPVDGTVADIGSNTPEYKADAPYVTDIHLVIDKR